MICFKLFRNTNKAEKQQPASGKKDVCEMGLGDQAWPCEIIDWLMSWCPGYATETW